MKHLLYLIIVILISQGCSNNNPINTVSREEGNLQFNFNKSDEHLEATNIFIALYNEDYGELNKEINFNEMENKQIFFENIESGFWQLFVEVVNQENKILYFGKTDVDVISGVTNHVFLKLNRTDGGINILIDFANDFRKNIVSIYPFFGNAFDYSGNGLNGLVNGPELVKDRFGYDNNAYHFDGINDFIHVNQDPKQQIEGDLTISLWFKANSFDGISESLIRFQADNTDNEGTNALYGLTFNNGSNNLTYTHENGNGTDNRHDFNEFEFETSRWYNVVIVRKTDQKIVELFVDGNLEDIIEYDENPNNGSKSFLRIGENQGTVMDKRFFHGCIDDIIILNRALSYKEIEYLYKFSKN